VAGFQARAALKNLFSELPDAEKQVVSEGATSILWFEHPAERFLLVTDAATAERVTEALRGEAQLNNSQQWLALNIEAGLPVIDAANSAQFIPQATNLQALGVSALKRAVIPARRWWRVQNSAGQTNERCGRWRAMPAVYLKRVKT
jgi:folate-binding Fe-S cluster repair protein YgfZ